MDRKPEHRENGMMTESGVPDRFSKEHIGCKVLFRLPNNAIAIEGIIDEFSPGFDYIHIGKRWIENKRGSVLAVISGPQRRREAIR